MRGGVKTVVYQSFRTRGVPPWVEACLQSTRAWATSRGCEHRFFDDAFFDFCPPWYRQRVGENILLMSDLARLVAARELLAEGFERAIWIDADVLIFAPDAFDLKADVDDASFALNTELWVAREQGQFVGWRRVNNAVCRFDRGNAFLDFYIDACQRIVRQTTEPLDRLGVGTAFLTPLHQLVPLPLIRGVGTFNPLLMEHLSRGNLEPLRAYRKFFDHPIAAANLCGSLRGQTCQGVRMDDAVYDGTVRALLGQAGGEISR
jgi:hypothetical protein